MHGSGDTVDGFWDFWLESGIALNWIKAYLNFIWMGKLFDVLIIVKPKMTLYFLRQIPALLSRPIHSLISYVTNVYSLHLEILRPSQINCLQIGDITSLQVIIELYLFR